jgi:A/G-specific adenine glycosylase
MVSQRGRVPKTLDEVARLPGAGQYLARAMLLIAYGVPGALLDSNMARVLERRFGPRQLSDIRYDPRLQAVASAMTACDRSLDVNFAILDLAADVCKSNKPICSVCPIRRGCPYPNIRGMVLK